MRKFIQLTSDCEYFEIYNNIATNELTLSWPTAISLKGFKYVGLYNLQICPENRIDEQITYDKALNAMNDLVNENLLVESAV